MKVLNYGSLNVDYVYSVDHIIVGGETQHSSKLEVFSGGKGLNQSIALAKAGVPVYHAGIVGTDGDILLDACKEAGVNTKYIRRLPVKGGAIMASLGILQSMLGFDESAQALMIALYIAMDSFGTACNVTGDGAIALIIDKIMGKNRAE